MLVVLTVVMAISLVLSWAGCGSKIGVNISGNSACGRILPTRTVEING